MIFPANWHGYVPVRPEKHVTPPIHNDKQIPRHMADLPPDGPPHPFLRGVVRVKVEFGIRKAINFLTEPAIKFLVIGPDDHLGIRVHIVSSSGESSGDRHAERRRPWVRRKDWGKRLGLVMCLAWPGFSDVS